MRSLLFTALILTLVSCEKEKTETIPVFNAETALSKMVFTPVRNSSDQIIGTRFTVPLYANVSQIDLSKNVKLLDSKLNVTSGVAQLYDTITAKFPQHDSTFTFTMTYKGETTTANFKMP